MIHVNGKNAKTMEFASFQIKDSISEDELIDAVLSFEDVFLKEQNGILFHCLVKNQQNTYANVLLAESEEVLTSMQKKANEDSLAKSFFSMIKEGSVTMHIHSITKSDFKIPEHFSCVEHGTFSLNPNTSIEQLLSKSNELEINYLNKFPNSKAHFIGMLDENTLSEVGFGKTLGKTRQICYGYFNDKTGTEFLSLIDDQSMKLDFYYVLA